MLTVLFYYTLVVMLVCVLAGALSLSAYFVSRYKLHLYVFFMFIFYFFDVSLVFKDDFIISAAPSTLSAFWEVNDAYASVLCGGGILLFLWLSVCRFLGKDGNPVLLYVPVALWVAASLAVNLFVPTGPWRIFLFYSMREVFLFWVWGCVCMWLVTSKNEAFRAGILRHRRALVACVALTVGIVVENVYVQLIFDPTVLLQSTWFFAERNIFENFLFITIATVTMRSAAGMLTLRYEYPPERSDSVMGDSIVRVLPQYCLRYGLSKREGEVLTQIVMGKDNQNIASSMSLAISTVKVHVHNILKKTGRQNRHDLIQDFWGS
ncbi:helix-turn-helix transcriptional regulator [Eggerthellaceae bacterium zg-1084]|uniref:Helix-turn-helix transcriptional regulator n=1 Tax=Berryella wangjianweii TaxID=2734634 RepID=A0A6M8J5Q9_9ACTN|nr:helix-turn-helix transcriptional regulator [Berryella wangjianweii]NPD30337.1 helix-turn-helix transcriptional regulator [Berryella wangjianweii]NPD32640.1 helix-turn-helix transcriptional regulator [Eggerthellaceae bacterium zg-997]QKF07018.1 helix-turn-helix transcriptional regulator [Berryella wangjianweii]